ncbi:hypothetical protein P9112_001965 [Eukaryota sp. TZLM1-RC]
MLFTSLKSLLFKVRLALEKVILATLFFLLGFIIIICFYLSRIHYIRQQAFFAMCALVSLLFGILAFINLTLTVWKGPGKISQLLKTHRKELKKLLNDPLSKKFFHKCDKCSQQRLFRCHHCRYCNICQPSYDHHCVVIATCVGWRNRHCFLSFLLCIYLGAIVACISHYPVVLSLIKTKYFVYGGLLPKMIVLSGALCLASLIALAPLLFSHLKYALTNSTTYDDMIMKNIRKEHPNVYDPFNKNVPRKVNWNIFWGVSEGSNIVTKVAKVFFPYGERVDYAQEMNTVFGILKEDLKKKKDQ